MIINIKFITITVNNSIQIKLNQSCNHCWRPYASCHTNISLPVFHVTVGGFFRLCDSTFSLVTLLVTVFKRSHKYEALV